MIYTYHIYVIYIWHTPLSSHIFDRPFRAPPRATQPRKRRCIHVYINEYIVIYMIISCSCYIYMTHGAVIAHIRSSTQAEQKEVPPFL